MLNPNKPLISIVGPTGTGKSHLAINLARAFNGEIVGCDSRQFYRYMDIGTAKPSPEERLVVPHHLIDIVNPDEALSLAQYQQLAYQAIDTVHQAGKLPFLVGGTGQYLWAVIEGWQVPKVAPDLAFRKSLEERATREGGNVLYQELLAINADAAGRVDSRNVRRVIRALEVNQRVEPAKMLLQHPPPYRTLIIGLTAARPELYRRVDQRVEQMMARGLVGEVEKLLGMGYDLELPAMSGIGYKQIGKALKGQLSLAEAVQQIKFETHRYIRQQYAWFRLKDERIRWLDVLLADLEQRAAGVIANWAKN